MARRRRRVNRDRRSDKDGDCCCGPVLHLLGRVEGRATPAGARVDLRHDSGVRAVANAALAPQAPNAVGNGYAETALDLAYGKPKDSVIQETTFEIHFSVESACGPCRVDIRTSGAVASHHQCLPESGFIALGAVEIHAGDDYDARTPLTLDVVATATACDGKKHACRMTLIGS